MPLDRSLALATTPDNRPFGDSGIPRGSARGWDFLGNVPVPLRQHIRDDLAGRVGAGLKCCFPMGQGGRGPFQRLRFIRSLDAFPDMLVSADYGNAFNRRFHAEQVETGAFTDARPDGIPALFADAGLIDPRGWIGVFATAPFVLLVDRNRLGNRPVPRRWADLGDPAYRDQIVFGGWKREESRHFASYNLFLLLCLLRMFGAGGLSRFLANVTTLIHSMQMPRIAGGSLSVGSLYVLPWSLAEYCPRRDATEVVWPEEGALAYPLWLTVKRDRLRRLERLIAYFHGADLARYLADNRYPALCPDVDPGVPAGARLTWPGFDYLRHRQAAHDVKLARSLFRAVESGWSEEVRQCA